MSGSASGNGGAGKGMVALTTVAPGCLRLHAHPKMPPPRAELPDALAEVLERWRQEDPPRRVRAVCPIVQGGATVEVLVWFDKPGWGKKAPPAARGLPRRPGTPGCISRSHPGSRTAPR
jgi:hypothetical protein